MELGDKLKDRAPVFDMNDPGDLEAFYDGKGSSFCEHWRKVILSNCEEIVRAKFELANQKISEDRIDCLAHLHDTYLDFLITHLEGRKLREKNVLASRIGA